MAVISLKAAKLDRIAARINAAHANAEAASATVVQCAVEAGQLLLEVKETMAHGAFGPWLDNNVTFARQTARHYMRLAKAVDAMSESKRSHVSVLPLREALRVIAGGDNKHSGWTVPNEEWFTPTPIIARTRSVLGSIDLDPASCAQAQKTVHAKKFFSIAQDGLRQEWRGKVFLNPPFTKTKIDKFVDKLIKEVESGKVTEAILLTNSNTDCKWFHEIAKHAAAICFTRQRIKFVAQHKKSASSPFGQAFAYFGNRVTRFKREFAGVGFVVVPG